MPGYDEALLLYLLGLGSPTFPLPPESYAAYCSSYQWKQIYGREVLYSGPLFTHQLSHLWIDFRGIRDAFMRDHNSDYFENTRAGDLHPSGVRAAESARVRRLRRALLGITASDGPGFETRRVNGIEREFYGYHARGAPYGPDDGTVSPWVVVASLPFAPEIVIPTIHAMTDARSRCDEALRVQAVVQPDVRRARRARPAGGSRPITSASIRVR